MIKFWKFFPVLISLAVCLGLLLVPAAMGVSAAEPASGKVGFRMPAEVEVVQGETFEFNVTIYNPHGVNMVAAAAAVRADDQTLLTVNDITLGDWPVELLKWIGVGEFEYDAACTPADPSRNTTIVHCTVNCTANATAEGVTTVRFVHDGGEYGDISSEVLDDSGQPQDILDWVAVQNMTVKVGPPTLTVNVTPAGKGDVSISGVIPSSYPNTTNLSLDEVVNLTAVASTPNWTFDHWSGDSSGSDNPTNVTMDSSKSVLAHFARYSLTVTNTTGGTVTHPGLGTFRYLEAEKVILVATNYTGYYFVNWTGDVGTIDDVDAATTNITMDGDYSIVANFAEVPATLEGHVGFYRADGPGNSTWETPLVVRFFNHSTKLEMGWSPINVTTNNTGVFAIHGIIPGTYAIGIKNWTCLSALVLYVTLNADVTTVVYFGTLIEADCDDNDKTDGSDYAKVLNNYNVRKVADPTFWATNELWKADYTRDDKIDGADYASVLNNYNGRGDIFYYTH